MIRDIAHFSVGFTRRYGLILNIFSVFFRKKEAYRARGKGREGRNIEIKGEVLLDGFFLKSISIPPELHIFFSLLASSKYIFLH